MIVRRLATELRKQNWTTVLLELVVVVAGIFLGLQADAWNEDRNDRKRERIHLEQIRADAASNADELRFLAEHHSELADEIQFAIGIVKRGRIEPDESERFKWAVLRLMQYPPAVVQTGGYDALIASGDFAVISNAELKTRLVTMRAYLDTIQERVMRLAGGNDRNEAFDAGVVYAIPHPSGRGVAWQVNFDALIEKPTSLGYLANERRNHSLVSEAYAAGAAESVEIDELIASLLGTAKAGQNREAPLEMPE